MNNQNPIFIPGPTNIPDRLRHAMSMPTMDHRASTFVDVMMTLMKDLKKIFKTDSGHIITFPATGTGGWEAAITNTLSPGDKVLVARFGVFSHKWIDLCQRHQLDVEIIETEWGEAAPVEEYATRLEQDTEQKIKAVLVTHNETATGVLSDVSAIRTAMNQINHPGLLYVDCVSSLGSIDFRMDEWEVDIAVSGSQKGFMLNTGMAILGVSEKAMTAMDTATCPRCFFDFRDMFQANQGGGFPYTAPVPLMMGLRESVDMLLQEGLDNVFARHHRIAEGIRAAVFAWKLKLVAKRPEIYSDSVSAIYVPKGFNSDDLTNHANDAYGMSFGVGLGQVAGKVFRIGHLGSLTDAMALSGIATIEMAMKDLEFPIELGTGVAAAQTSYRNGSLSQRRKAA